MKQRRTQWQLGLWRTAILALPLAIAALTLLPMWVLAQEANTGEMAPQSPGALEVRIEVLTDTAPLMPGDIVTYTIDLRHVGGTSPVTVSLTNTLPAAIQIGPARSIKIGEVSPNAAPLRIGFQEGALRWRGGLSPDAHLRIRYPARIRNCFAHAPLDVESRVAAQAKGGALQSDGAALSVDCGGADPSAITVSQDFVAELTTGETETDASLRPSIRSWLTDTLHYVGGVRTFWRVTAVNDGNSPAALKLAAQFPGTDFLERPTVRGLESTTLGWVGCLTCTVPHDNHMPVLQGYLLRLAPGETREFLAPLGALDEESLEVEQHVLLGYCLTGDGQNCPGEEADNPMPPDSMQWLENATITPQHRDLGDAPDSSNHSGAAMTAYPGVAAAYPTVFDPATGLPQGPAHLDPRSFHLGWRVSPEAEADVGPDLDPTHNILPNANRPNRDRGDDGVGLYQTTFTRCATTTIPVRVFISPAAVTYFQESGKKGYINAWLDGNRDGDWADAVQCPDTNQPALEHIAIDHQIDVVALGAGLHTIPVPTGPAPWPNALAEQASWVRVTLSEAPANKPLTTAGVAHGDGRGFAGPFARGETEDYRYLPPGAPGAGADVTVAQTARIERAPDLSNGDVSLVESDANVSYLTVNFKIEYGNEGTETAENVSFTSIVNTNLANVDLQNHVQTNDPHLTWTRTGNEVRFDRGYLPPGVRGTVVLKWKVEEGEMFYASLPRPTLTRSGAYTNTVTVSSDNDVAAGNNTAVATAEAGLPAPTIGFKPEGSQYLHGSGMTCGNNVTVGGRAVSGATVRVLVNGNEVADTTAGDDGAWSIPFSLPDGARGRIRALAERDGQTSPLSSALFIGVDNSLPWDPSTLVFVTEAGQVLQAFDGKGNDIMFADGWTVRVRPWLTSTVSLRYCGDEAAPLLSLRVGQQEIPLADENGDGFYEGIYAPPATVEGQAAVTGSMPMTLQIESDNVQYTYNGQTETAAAGQVYNGQNGSAIAGTTVALLQALETDGGTDNGGVGLWQAADYGQQNPLATNSNGAYDFATIAGSYRLRAVYDGYQSYDSMTLNVLAESVNRALPLTPAIGETSHYVIGVGAGGFTPSVLRVPPNAIIEWVNVGVEDHTTTSTDPLLAPGTAGDGGWDSGVLAAGAAYRLRMTEPGIYAYADATNPLHTATIIVDDSLPGPYGVYLPLWDD